MTRPDKSPGSARRIAYYASLTAIAFALSAAEALIPIPVPAPGVKLGLANVVTLIILLGGGNPAYALAVVAIRCTLAAFASGAFSTLLFSLAGGLFSCIVMWFLLRFNFTFGIAGISVAGALAHNVSQLAAAAAIARDLAVFGYLPALLIAGVAAGCATGFIAARVSAISKFMRKL